jgi:hypothetical protein
MGTQNMRSMAGIEAQKARMNMFRYPIFSTMIPPNPPKKVEKSDMIAEPTA